ncbi:unnamed protein product [Closterium sp. NIES-53]
MASFRVLAFDHEGRPVAFDTWHDDLQLYLLSDIKDSVSLFDHVSGVAPTPPTTADGGTRSQWLSRDATAHLAICNHLLVAECTHFGQHRTAQALYDAVVACYSSPATVALGRLLLLYLFPELSAFASVADLVTHLRTSDTRYRATVLAEFLATNQPPMFITLYFIVSRLPDSLRTVRDHFLSLDPTSLTVDLLEQHLLAAETSAIAVGAARGTPRPPFFEGCSPSPLSPSFASAAAADVSVTEDSGAASSVYAPGLWAPRASAATTLPAARLWHAALFSSRRALVARGGFLTVGRPVARGGASRPPPPPSRPLLPRRAAPAAPVPICPGPTPVTCRGDLGGGPAGGRALGRLNGVAAEKPAAPIARETIAPVAREPVAPVAREPVAPVARESVARLPLLLAAEPVTPVARVPVAPVASVPVAPVARVPVAPLVLLCLLLRSAAAARARVAGVVEVAAVVVEVAVGAVAGAAVEVVEAVEVVAAVGLVAAVGALVAAMEAAEGVAAVEAVGLVVVGLDLGVEALVVVSDSSSSVRARPSCPSSSLSGWFSVGRLGVVRPAKTCGKFQIEHRCFSRLDDPWRAEFGDDVERPRWADLLRSGVAIFDLDYDAIISAMYALSFSAEGDCYRCVPPDPGIAAATLGASASGTLPGTASAEALHTFTLDYGASRCFFRDSTTLTPLPAPVPVRLAYPSRGPVNARSSTVLPCPTVPSGSLSGLHLPSFSTNLMSTAALQDAMVTTTTPRGQRVSIYTCTRMGCHSSARVESVHAGYRASSGCCVCSGVRVRSGSRLLLVSPPVAPDSSVAPPRGSPLPATPSWHALPVSRLWSNQVSASPPALTCPALPSLCQGAVARRSSLLLVSPDNCSPAHSPHGRSFTLPDSPQQNGIAERRIVLVMEVARTSMIHAAAPHFLWPFVVRYAAHQLNLWPRVSFPETSPTLRWTGKVGDASVFRVWGSRASVRDTSADKLSARAIPCVFLGFVPDAPGWHFYHPTSRRVLPSQDVTFDKSVPFYRLFPYRSAPPPPPPLFLAPGPPPVDPLPPQGPAPSGVSQVDPLPGTAPIQVAVGSGVAGGVAATGPGGARTSGAGAAETGGVGCAGTGDPTEPGAAGAGGAGAGGAGVRGPGVGDARAAGAGVGGTGAGGYGPAGAGVVDPGAGGAGGTIRPRLYFVPLLQQVLGVPSSTGLPPPFLCPPPRRTPRSRPPPVPGTHAMALRPSSVPLRVPLPAPPESSLPEVLDLAFDRAHAASPTVSCLLATAVTDPSIESADASALVAELLDFAAARRLDYATALVTESVL